MKVVVVDNETLAIQWLHFPLGLYKHDAAYIRPLDKDVAEVFDPQKNKFFKHGECERWLIQTQQNKTVARIAVFINKKYTQEQPTGGFGFFECIDDKTVAHFTFDKAKEWLQEKGMHAMDGPINFGERDKWWGLLVNGFEEPLYCMNYNLPYYQALYESYGFQVYFNQLCYGMPVNTTLDPKLLKWHAFYKNHPDFDCRHITKKEISKFAEDFTIIYNKAWAKHGGGKTMEVKQAKILFNKMKPIIDEKITWFIYHKNQPIGMWVNIPDINQYFKHFNGKFGLLQKLYFLYLKATGACKRFVGVVYGIVPEFQGKGTDAYMIVECGKVVQPNLRYQKYEMQWIGDFNPKMINLAKTLGASEVRRLSTYRYLFDREKEFVRHPMLG